jgi:hypothetical protein
MRGKTFLFAVALAVPFVAVAQDPAASGQLEAAATTSPREKIAYADGAIQEMLAAEKAVRKLLDAAAKEGESASDKITCLNNKLASIRALKEVSDGASAEMKNALADNQAEIANREFRKIAVALAKVRQFVAESEACVGQAGTTGGTENIDISGDLNAEDFDDYFSDAEDDVPPADVTPFE